MKSVIKMKKILIVEDELAYLKILNTQLTNNQYKVIEAINGKKGLEKAKSENPDLILLDIRMPLMDGITMLNLLRKEKLNKHTKVILLSNLELDDKTIELVIKDKSVNYFIKSDMNLKNLLEKITEILGN